MTAPAAPTKFSGSITALATPFYAGRLDEAGFRRLVDWQIANGTDGLVPCGTTGESPTLSHDEHKRIVALCVEAAAGRVPVIAGTGSNNTAEAIDLTRHAKEAGADAALIVTPYYNKPTQSGLIAHFTAIARAVDLPIIIYNIPPRCVIDMTVETMAELAKLPQIVGVKDATADLVRPLKTQAAIGPDFAMLSGEDVTALPFLVQGGHGCISVTANVAPALCAAMHDAWREGDIAGACGINRKLLAVHDAMFCEINPVPVKYGLSLLGIGDGSCRLPLAPLSQASKARVEAAMRGAGLIG